MKDKSRVDRSHLKRRKTPLGKLPDAVVRRSVELSPSPSDPSPVGRDLARDTTSLHPGKQQRDTTDGVPVKRARLTRTGTQQLGVEDEDAERANKRTPQSRRNPPRRPQTSSLALKAEGAERVSPAALLRKLQSSSGPEGNEVHQLRRARLTRKNLALFNKMKGPNKVSAPDSVESTIAPSTTKTTSTMTSGFAMRAHENGMLDPHHSKPPANLEYIQKRYARSRVTTSPSESRFRYYANRINGAVNEATITVELSRHLLKDHEDEGYHQSFNKAFTAFPKDVGFNNGLSAPQPDFVEGLEMQKLCPFPVNKHISGAVLYDDNPNSLTVPHLAGEWKGPGGDIAKATLQSGYEGAALVYARNEALSLIGKADPPGHAEVRTFTTDGTNLNFFAHYAAPSEDGTGTLEYHQYQYASMNIKDTHQGHKDGRRGLRNEQDHAREQSYALRSQLIEYWKKRGSALRTVAEGAMSLPGESSVPDEEPLDDRDGGGDGSSVQKRKASLLPHEPSRRKRAKHH